MQLMQSGLKKIKWTVLAARSWSVTTFQLYGVAHLAFKTASLEKQWAFLLTEQEAFAFSDWIVARTKTEDGKRVLVLDQRDV